MASAIFFVFIVMALELFVSALRTTSQGERQGMAMEQARNFLYRISTELRTASVIVEPDMRVLLSQDGAAYLVLRTVVDDQDQVVAYRTLPDGTAAGTRYLQRCLYDDDYAASDPSSQHVVAGSVRQLTTAPTSVAFQLGWGPELSSLGVLVTVTAPEAQPLGMRTKVVMRRSALSEIQP